MTKSIESYFKQPTQKCSRDNNRALKASFVNGGIPLCGDCWKGDDRAKAIAERRNLAKGGRVGGTRGVYLPKSIVEMYEAAMVDEELVSVREDIATFEARIRQLTSQIRADPRNSTSWATVFEKNLQQQLAAIKRGSLTYAEAFADILEFMQSPVKEKLVWSEVYEVSEMKRRAVATESKRMNDLGWSPDMVMSMFAEVADILKPLLSELNMRIFMDALASSRLFNNQQFQIIDQVNLSKRTVDEHLLMQEMDKKSPVRKKTKQIEAAVETAEVEGVFEPVSDSLEAN